MDTKPAPFAEARRAYENGMSLERLRRRFHLSEGELRDVAPEEFIEDPQPEGNIGGY
ncbi:MAG: hypothetical protein ACE10G_01450 [Gemmatimonadales bacterium]